MKITKITKEEYKKITRPVIVESLTKLKLGEARKIEDYNFKSPLPAYLNSMIKDKRYSTHKVDETTYYVIRVK